MQVPLDAPLPVAVPMRRRGNVPVALLALTALASSLWVLHGAGLRPDPGAPDHQPQREVKRVVGVAGTLFFGLGAASLLVASLRRGPALELRQDALVSRANPVGELVVRWEAVLAARAVERAGELDLVLDLLEDEDALDRVPLWRRWLARLYSVGRDGQVFAVGSQLDAPAPDLAARIQAELARRRAGPAA